VTERFCIMIKGSAKDGEGGPLTQSS
jgi:hypothetical protein